jgi:two-component system, cell cycle response regulator
MKILLADDELSSLKIVEKILTKWGYEVVLAADGNKAWSLLETDPSFHIAVLDWMMPGLDGLEVCRRIRQRKDIPYTAVIVLSARDNQEDIDQGYAAGADDYLVKPINANQLKQRLAVVERVLKMERDLRSSNDALSRLVSSLGKVPA